MTPAEMLGPYRLVSRLAHGGMGEVWEAEGPEGRVALKLIPEFLMTDPALAERLEREAEALKRLDRPGIVRLHEFGLDQGRAYLVMELLKGETMAERLSSESSTPISEVERVAVALAETLAYLHAQGVIHRDLKPQNIFFTEDGGVKLIDLGVAKILDEASMTVTGSHFGTPAYMSPESFRDAKRVTAESDIWSLGVILYEMAAGQLPFPGTTAASIIAKIADTNVTPQSPTRLRPEVSGRLAQMIEKCLERDAGKRPTAAALVHSLTGQHPAASGSGVQGIKIAYANKMKEGHSMVYFGFFLVALGVCLTSMIEGLHIISIFYAPSACSLLVFCTLGAAFVSYRPTEIWAAVLTCLRKEVQSSKESLEISAKIFATLSRYAMNAAWLGLLLGSIHVMASYEEAGGNIGKLAGGIALAVVCLLLGIILSKLIFDPMKNNLERKAGLTAFQMYQPQENRPSIYPGLLLFAAGVYGAASIEGIMPLEILFVPAAWVIIGFCSLGATLVSFRPGEIGAAVWTVLSKSIQRPREELMNGIKIFSLLSRYSVSASWVGFLLGVIHVLGGLEAVRGEYGRLAGGFALAFLTPFLGYVIANFVFDPMRRNLETRAGLTLLRVES